MRSSKIGKYGKIDRKFKKQWVEALESGEYKQVGGCLRTTDNEFCCLGVACDLIPDVGNWSKAVEYGEEFVFILNGYEQFVNGKFTKGDGVMPRNLRHKIKLTARAQERLYKMNDSGVSFKDIAKWIKKYL